MSYIQRAINEAIEKGSYPQYNWSHPHRALLDPLFWQALGKARGKDINAGEQIPCPDGKIGCAVYHTKPTDKWWREPWHRFIDHLASGGTAEDFFKSLT